MVFILSIFLSSGLQFFVHNDVTLLLVKWKEESIFPPIYCAERVFNWRIRRNLYSDKNVYKSELVYAKQIWGERKKLKLNLVLFFPLVQSKRNYLYSVVLKIYNFK